MAKPPETPANEPEGWRDVVREATHFLWWYAKGAALATAAIAVLGLIVLWIW